MTRNLSGSATEGRSRKTQEFSWQQNFKIRLISLIGWTLIRTIGVTLRIRVEDTEQFRAIRESQETLILAFWHNQIFTATYIFR